MAGIPANYGWKGAFSTMPKKPWRHRLTCGQMARANGITEKTLRFYQKKGLLQPAYVDDETNFRYYNVLQSTKLDMIAHLRAIGFSLDDIKEIDDRKEIDYLRDRTSEQLASIREQQHALAIAERLAADLVEDCDTYLNAPICDQIMLENLPVRRRLEFKIPPLASMTDDEELTGSDLWEWVVRYVKQTIIERNWPLSLFRNVGFIAPRECLDADNVWSHRAFVLVDESFGSLYEQAHPHPSGSCLTFYTKQGYGDNGETLDRVRFQRMLDYAEAKGFTLRDDPFCEGICRFNRFLNQSLETFCRYVVPVERTERP